MAQWDCSSGFRLEVKDSADQKCCQTEAKRLARRVGFSIEEAAAIAIVTGELASNMIKYAQGGTIILRVLPEEQGIEVEAKDNGPGIEDIPAAQQDGISEGHPARPRRRLESRSPKGLGYGLGCVRRLMDEVAIQSKPGQGTIVIARKHRWKKKG
jgi:serine/threonine-protein kinase RsbT